MPVNRCAHWLRGWNVAGTSREDFPVSSEGLSPVADPLREEALKPGLVALRC